MNLQEYKGKESKGKQEIISRGASIQNPLSFFFFTYVDVPCMKIQLRMSRCIYLLSVLGALKDFISIPF